MAVPPRHESRFPAASIDEGAEDDELVTGEAVALDLRPASFVLRAAGSVIDFIVTVIVLLGCFLLLVGLVAGFTLDDAAISAVVITLLVLGTIVVPIAVETLSMGKSLGKLAVGIRIVRDDGGAIGFRHAFIRALTGFLEIFATFGGLAAVTALLNSRSKRIGDLLAGTYAQYERVKDPDDPLFAVPAELYEWSRVADVARMPDRLSRRISQFLIHASGFLPDARTRVGTALAVEAAQFVDPVPSVAPEPFLIAVTAIRREREATALTLERQRMERLEPVLHGLPHGFPDRD